MKNYLIILIILIIFILFCSGVLFSCAEPESVIDISIQDLDNIIKENFDFSEHDDYGYDEFSSDKIKSLFGITPDDAVQIIARKKIDFINAFNEEILILAEAENNEKAEEIGNKLKIYKAQKLKILTDYTIQGNEAQYYLVEASEITVSHRYVFWVVDTRRTEINAVINQYIKDSGKK